MESGPRRRTVERGEDGYEAARRATLWNERTPERYPDLIVRAESEADVVAAVRLARNRGMRLAVRSGGHSWAGNHVREGGLLLDLSGLDQATVDPAAMTAAVGPACQGTRLLERLAEDELFFPVGHCVGVGVGGYLLQGGFGWNGRVHGPACMSVEALDMVMADGEVVHASEQENSDLLWAARGAGPGFFAVVTRFHLRLYERPRFVANAAYVFGGEVLEDVFRWVHAIGPRLARILELNAIVHRDERGELEVVVAAPVLAASESEARAALAVLEECPLLDRAKAVMPFAPGEMEHLFAGVHAAYPDEHRYVADNMWTHASIEELLPGLRRIAETMPPAPSHMLWLNWGPGPQPPAERPGMAFSVEDETYIAVYGVWRQEAEDERYVTWVTERMREMEHLASGIQLADENLVNRPARFVSDENLRRLDELRAIHDPEGMFHPWLGRPWEPGR